MTSVPSASTGKGKGRVPSDWRLRALSTVPTPDELADLRLSIKAFPEQKDTVPAEYAVNTQFLINDMPWISYWADDGEPIQSTTTNKPVRQRDDDGDDGGDPDDPMQAATLRAAHAMGYQRLEGNPPDRFDGNRARTRRFLLQFRQFMLMNDDTSISRNDIKKCTYFLSLIEGPKVEGWTERSVIVHQHELAELEEEARS